MNNKVPLTKAGADTLEIELKELKSVRRPKVIQAISEAREHGDLKENAEYHAAKDEQGLMEARISELTDLVGRAQVIDPATLAHERISFGSTVQMTEQNTEEEVRYTIVGGQESNPRKGFISIHSPMAKALLGKEEGDEAALVLPAGKKTYDIEDVSYVQIVL